MKTVVVTGGMGSGKSAVCALLSERGVPVYDSDAHAKALYDRSPELTARLEVALGATLRGSGSSLDRKKLAGIIFQDPSARRKVEAVVHPAVLEDFLRWKRNRRPKGWRYGPVPFVVLESAIIQSVPVFDGVGDRVVLVEADEQVCVRRAAARDGASEEEVLRRIRLQSHDRNRVDAIVRNDGTLAELSGEVDRVFLNLFAF